MTFAIGGHPLSFLAATLLCWNLILKRGNRFSVRVMRK